MKIALVGGLAEFQKPISSPLLIKDRSIPSFIVNHLHGIYAKRQIPKEELLSAIVSCQLDFPDDARLKSMQNEYFRILFDTETHMDLGFVGTNHISSTATESFIESGQSLVERLVHKTEEFRARYVELWEKSLQEARKTL